MFHGIMNNPVYYSSIVMEGMSKTTTDLRTSGKPVHADYDRIE
jgi:hypothetical protein